MSFSSKLTYMLRGEDLAWHRMLNPFEPSAVEVAKVQREIEGTLLTEVFTTSFFASVLGQAKAYETGKPTELSNAYSILQPPEQRAKLLEFLSLMKPKMSGAHWKHLSERLRSDSRSQSLLALFEVTLSGNLLAQLPSDRVELNVPTVGGKDADIGVLLDGRMVHLEVTVLDESDAMKARRPMMAKQKYPIWTPSASEVDGTRLLARIESKAKEFKPKHPNVLAIQIFSSYDWSPLARENYLHHEVEDIGLLLPFGRIEMIPNFVKEPDVSCRVTDTERRMLLNLLNGNSFFPLGYI